VNDIVYGLNPVLEALRSGRAQRILLADGAKAATAAVAQLTAAAQVPIQRMSRRDLDGLLPGTNHQGVAAEVRPFRYTSLDDLLSAAASREEPPFLLILDCIQDPQNLGTLLRTAEAVGVHGVIVPHHRAAEITPAVERASAGAVEYLHVAQVTNLTQTALALKQRGLWIAGVEAAPSAVNYTQASLTGPLAVVVGSEGRGISRLVRESCDFLVKIPMRGKITSLNAAVAGSVVLYEALRQRQAQPSDLARTRESAH
jgi:23S rRNA (guanosine2251-2'-O)-methyltransferase